ncbi:hypothetical protein MmTuc01_2329 [Methanosarcina mazei Tuc01]|uniref:Uncharacterized protein n=1 Tax=Methanosarcina mazei Tuc01 TaxID=1236903 RepID=M1QKX4_METMZ|nr:hypothetical protein [Methanosarcina mazei]AGF97644.1 hypothetical protein MmTuc01_2329 [Methanosarcina mazei Tuc01]
MTDITLGDITLGDITLGNITLVMMEQARRRGWDERTKQGVWN